MPSSLVGIGVPFTGNVFQGKVTDIDLLSFLLIIPVLDLHCTLSSVFYKFSEACTVSS